MSLRALGDSLRTYLEESSHRLDVGLPVPAWTRASDSCAPETPPHVEIRGAGDADVSTAEIFQEALRQLSESGSGGSAGLLRFFHDRREAIPPWLLDDGDPTTRADQRLREAVDHVVRRETRAARGDRLDLLLHLIRSLHAPRSAGGLGLRYDAGDGGDHPRWTGSEAYERGAGDCNAFSFIFYALCVRAGLRVTFIRIAAERDLDSGRLQPLDHVGVAVALDPARPEEWTAVDPGLGFVMSGREWEWYPWSLNDMMANHLRNTAFSNLPEGLEGEAALAWREERLLEAVELAPYNFEIIASASYFFGNLRHDAAAASRFAERAADLNPSGLGYWSGPLTHP